VSSPEDAVWIDVGMWSALSGRLQPFTEVECDPPERPPAEPEHWQEWAVVHLAQLAKQDAWQPGRYHFTVERRDPSGRSLDSYAHGIWEWQT
jgi:hypothetical protein